MRVLQVLPALNSGGVERGTVELARELVRRGHESFVMSAGGRLVPQLEREGSLHLLQPVHRKSLASLGQIRPVRQLLAELRPDIVHVRSRLPAWIVWLACRKLTQEGRPRLVSTFHGLYSVNRYSAVMARAEHLIAVSRCVERYIVSHYAVEPSRITVIPRGFDPTIFFPGPPDEHWRRALYAHYPQLEGKRIILMPGRLSRWKGQADFLRIMARLKVEAPGCHGVVIGEAEPAKQHYRRELEAQSRQSGLQNEVTFLGHRDDIDQFYRLAEITCHLSSKPEPFGRTLTEALATGTKVVAYDRGGAGETLRACFPDGLVPADDLEAYVDRLVALLDLTPIFTVPAELTLDHQFEATLGVYERLLGIGQLDIGQL